MTVTEAFQTVAEGRATLLASVSATRIKPPGPWQNLAAPYVIHRPMRETPVGAHETRLRVRRTEFEYCASVVATGYPACESLAKLVRDEMEGAHNVSGTGVVIRWTATEIGEFDAEKGLQQFDVIFAVTGQF